MPQRGGMPTLECLAGGLNQEAHGHEGGGARACGLRIGPMTRMRPVLQYGH